MSAKPPSPTEITQLLAQWNAGDKLAFESLFPLLYPTLSKLANRELRKERAGHTLQTTALVNEAFIELAGQRRVHFGTRGHFLAVAAFVMRRILTEHARSRSAVKRGGGNAVLTLKDPDSLEADDGLAEIAAVDAALDVLETVDPRAARVVVLRFFGGLSHEEAAEVLGISVITCKREWALAKAWLKQELSPS